MVLIHSSSIVMSNLRSLRALLARQKDGESAKGSGKHLGNSIALYLIFARSSLGKTSESEKHALFCLGHQMIYGSIEKPSHQEFDSLPGFIFGYDNNPFLGICEVLIQAKIRTMGKDQIQDEDLLEIAQKAKNALDFSKLDDSILPAFVFGTTSESKEEASGVSGKRRADDKDDGDAGAGGAGGPDASGFNFGFSGPLDEQGSLKKSKK